ncbi:MAG TPA: hypothetical protein PLG09_10780 [Syntrophomonadaceae bacterium]|nr:hypothetical protein [Syntrophomonadaceae bacterium]HOQ10596.1 hypothetical protein [Syntrophomonadaceae bacterium]HPU49710.1 hypothetical protein [Syntrophomonadaceae bacterium]
MCFLKEDVYVGYSLEDLAKVRQALANAGIKYSYKVFDHSGQWAGRGTYRGRYGSMGLNMKYTKQYTVSVRRKDYEQASYLVNKALHQR